MSLFLTIFEGTTPADARPVVAISDADIIAAVRRLLFERLSDNAKHKVVHLKPMPEVSRDMPSGITWGGTADGTRTFCT
jgi:hypothetical protein